MLVLSHLGQNGKGSGVVSVGLNKDFLF